MRNDSKRGSVATSDYATNHARKHCTYQIVGRQPRSFSGVDCRKANSTSALVAFSTSGTITAWPFAKRLLLFSRRVRFDATKNLESTTTPPTVAAAAKPASMRHRRVVQSASAVREPAGRCCGFMAARWIQTVRLIAECVKQRPVAKQRKISSADPSQPANALTLRHQMQQRTHR